MLPPCSLQVCCERHACRNRQMINQNTVEDPQIRRYSPLAAAPPSSPSCETCLTVNPLLPGRGRRLLAGGCQKLLGFKSWKRSGHKRCARGGTSHQVGLSCAAYAGGEACQAGEQPLSSWCRGGNGRMPPRLCNRGPSSSHTCRSLRKCRDGRRIPCSGSHRATEPTLRVRLIASPPCNSCQGHSTRL